MRFGFGAPVSGPLSGPRDLARIVAEGEAIGLELDRTKEGMGMRSQRYAMVVEDGTVTGLHVEKPGEYAVSSAEAMLERL